MKEITKYNVGSWTRLSYTHKMGISQKNHKIQIRSIVLANTFKPVLMSFIKSQFWLLENIKLFI